MATPTADRRKALVVGVVLVAIVVAYVVYAVAWNQRNDSGTTPSGLDKAGCMALYDTRVGHDPGDNAFWQGLVECANKGLLPPGQNDPGFYGGDVRLDKPMDLGGEWVCEVDSPNPR